MTQLPSGTRLRLDHSARHMDAGRTLLGGSPLRLLRLRPAGVQRLDRWAAGEPVGDDPDDQRLATRLLDAGLVHPIPPPGGPTRADVTLVVPVKDNEPGLRRLLDATVEVQRRIVVDDGSRDALALATVRNETPTGPAAARNAGWRLAETGLVAFLDSDTRPEPGWLDDILPLFADSRVVAVAPRVRGSRGDSTIARYEWEGASLDLGGEPAPVRPMSRVSYVPSAALVVRRSALSNVDGFDAGLRFGEDVDLVWRLVAEGGVVRYQPESVVWHDPRESSAAWLRQRFDYGTSAAPLSVRHPGMLAPLRVSRWSAAAWALVGTGRPLAGLVVAGVTAGLLPRKLTGRGIPVSESLRLAGYGHFGAGSVIADALRRTWWPFAIPFALVSGRARLVLLASLLPCLLAAVSDEHELDALRWLSLRVADDLAYAAGVWAGCVRHRTAAPLVPRFAEWPGRSG